MISEHAKRKSCKVERGNFRQTFIETPSVSALLFLVVSAAYIPVLAASQDEALQTINPSQLYGEGSEQSLFAAQSLNPAVTMSASILEVGLEDAVKRAVGWHPSIGESVSELYQQQQNIRAARAGYFPQLSIGVVGGYESEYDGDGDGHAVQLYLSQVLYDFGKISSEVDAATAGAQVSQARVLQQVDLIGRDTAQAAIEVQRYQALLSSAEEQIQGVSAISRLVSLRNERGASSRSDVLQAQSRIESARATRQQLLAQLNRWKGVLQNLMGVEQPIALTMRIPETVVRGCQVDPVQASYAPAVLLAEAQRAEAVAQLKEAKAQSWPTLSLDGSVNSYLDQEYVDANALNNHENAVFLNLSMPIYQGGRIFANRDAAGFALRSAEAAKDNARLSAVRDLRISQNQSDGLEKSLSILDARLRAISETRDLYRQQYSSLGTRTLVELLNSEQELYQARIEKNNTEYDLNKLRVDCLYSVGEIRNAFNLQDRPIQGVKVLP
ncbi:TolC family outer membrane protein [Microbulbifer pacificus]|uniref:TolC family outer membrane protein n=1 Tax=Microbulbifer pacificus TaxID=407164 RepID=UPI001F35C3E2|nr:TolC family outer membrane protein [Microbulbifer pacificus]